MINDLQTKCYSYKYVDGTCIVYTGSDSQAPNLQEAADAAYLWTIQNDMKINKSKTKELVIILISLKQGQTSQPYVSTEQILSE